LNNDKDKLGKFDSKADKCIFLGYSSSSIAYRVYNKRTLVVEESVHVPFDEIPPQVVGKVSSSFEVSRIITKDIVKDGFQREDPSKMRTSWEKNETKEYNKLKNKKPHLCLLMIGFPGETIHFRIFLDTSKNG